MDTGHWNIEAVGEFDPSEFFGFIYEIEEVGTGRAYIGKKFFRFKRKKTKADPSRTKDSDWRDYTSSCVPLQEAIQEQGKDKFAFRILSLCSGRCQLTYEEQQMQFTHDVLRAKLPNGERKYWNRTIGHFLFAGVEKQTEETKRKISEALKGVSRPDIAESNQRRICSPETKAKMVEAHTGILHTEEAKAKIGEAAIGRRSGVSHTPEAKAKIGEASRGRNVGRVPWNKGLTKQS